MGTPTVSVDPQGDRVDVAADGRRFAAYLSDRADETLEKPVCFPLRTARGTTITRGHPLEPREGERVDHPHHVGFWFTYGKVGGVDFWADGADADGIGTIRHREIERATGGDGRGELAVTADWLRPGGDSLLREETTFVFRAASDARTIDRRTTLEAVDPVAFGDTKEGMVGIRVARGLEHPTDEPITVADDRGETTEVPAVDDGTATGEYLSSEGVAGLDVWGTRARWMRLAGTVEDERVALTIMDHPDNPGYPTHWHARGYGLFAANPFGPEAFTDGERTIDFSLAAGEAATFRHRVAVHSGEPPSPDELDELHAAFTDATRFR